MRLSGASGGVHAHAVVGPDAKSPRPTRHGAAQRSKSGNVVLGLRTRVRQETASLDPSHCLMGLDLHQMGHHGIHLADWTGSYLEEEIFNVFRVIWITISGLGAN